ncbi:MlaD family protein [Desulfosediminicola sp.]|uniref:MlaD family protein n=1 Tax=Desulfosediminicola sp. TaxID=2886825 RepID=UPI003AF2E97F
MQPGLRDEQLQYTEPMTDTSQNPDNELSPHPQIAQPEIKVNKGISVLWTLPLLALVICGWLLYQAITNAGIEVTVYFDDATGITSGKTQVMNKGIPVGLVKNLQPDIRKNKVKATIVMDKSMAESLVEDTLFWIVSPELSAASIRGLDTIVSGAYIAIRQGVSDREQRVYNGLDSAPPVGPEAPGLHLTLKADELGSIQKSTGIYYKNIEIGKVQGYKLAYDKTILIHVYITPEYSDLIHTESRFCNASGFSVSGELPNIKVQMESLSALLRGGILVHTPKELSTSPPATNGSEFKLYKNFEDADYGIPMTMQLASGSGIVEGSTKIVYRGIDAGFVKDILINNDENKSVTANILLDPRAEFILRENTTFWIVNPSISASGVKNFRNFLTGSHITFKPGDGDFKNHFTILPEPPPQTPLRPGSHVQLKSSNGVNLSNGTAVYYKEIKVGEVVSVSLEPDSDEVLITLFLYEPYGKLVFDSSIFWLQSGVDIEAGINGLKVDTGPLTRILSGGVVFTTPDRDGTELNETELQDKVFRLYGNYDSAVAATPALQPAGVQFQLITDDAASLSPGTPVMNKSLKIGHITGFSFSRDQKSVLIDCFVQDQYRHLIHDSTRFYKTGSVEMSGGLGGLDLKFGSLESIFKGGINTITTPGNVADSTAGKLQQPLPLHADFDSALHAGDRTITVRFEEGISIGEGSQVRYKGVPVGKVTRIRFGEDLQSVDVEFRIEPGVAPLFKTTTRIWQVTPEISLAGIKNIETAITGAYLTFLPGAGKPTRRFTGLSQPPQPGYLEDDSLQLILEASHLGSLSMGSPLYYRDLKVGEVTGFELSPSFRIVYVFIRIEPRYAAIVRENSKFWNVSGARVTGGIFSGITVSTGSVEAIVRGGINIATPVNEPAQKAVEKGHKFLLHDEADPEWLDWTPKNE